MKEFLVGIAKKLGMDPFQPETWYNFPRKKIEEIKVCILID
jgi:hypothetical protein